MVEVVGIVSGVPQHASPQLIFPHPPARSQYSVLIELTCILLYPAPPPLCVLGQRRKDLASVVTSEQPDILTPTCTQSL